MFSGDWLACGGCGREFLWGGSQDPGAPDTAGRRIPLLYFNFILTKVYTDIRQLQYCPYCTVTL